ncbi:class I SAM-dependent RNA methyltransferase [Anaerosalibacter bizertensis]|uniref:Class I SAM-dependent RNA methyltransferase n=1 Tax=Anaerosalibacter bizertensis TaxID=932217 RepID=A0A9Q4AEJ8_9FIRM|nr:class I SAM-dependent RNA methyltransferase [Anaerosalibacter bizertensis]MBV1820283.1 class I SAM-dependent RNA methyltransferase [Bacteroidales bacterium MSK.15.36]MCB5560513.1 class I SAM-dependent RNA methyltransferase [Anaerosalibacter bizertensis]MCG4565994.1 class I SAM-dependent RNA methyltransferase [Anaerosalibacter bizertensis]MCG4583392.1 class I SAM-dependent RNA methyltransferase [Anaerosalibacter bizertensis]
MEQIELIATSTFGLESVVKREVLALGYEDIEVENGKVTFKCDEKAIPKANIWLRTADRVLLKMGEFKATSFEELFEKTKALPWEDWITEDGEFTVVGKAVDSKLMSVPDCQSIVKKAVVEKLKTKYNTEWFKETGAKFTIQVSILKDIATLTIDTSGEGLHKRGYRLESVEAPIKETLAAALVQLSFWNHERVLVDPFCGSGTIAIEAAMIGKNIAPGIQRNFVSEEWPRVKKEYWKDERISARKAIIQDRDLKIIASDIDKKAAKIAEENAFEIGVDDCIEFKTEDVLNLKLNDEYGVIISNPPYGERIGEKKEVEKLYRGIGKKFNKLDTWSIYILTSNTGFEKLYGKKADRRRKLFNGRIRVDYYQYYGPRPPRK